MAETSRHGVFDNRSSITHTNIGPADYSEALDSDQRDADFMNNYLKTTQADLYSSVRSAVRSFTKKKS
jgi:hypothetical protein